MRMITAIMTTAITITRITTTRTTTVIMVISMARRLRLRGSSGLPSKQGR
ncbi:hypothetical protein [Phreatobacter oligotrophus]|nr:hypothetical protein [Phreatobacter oligotrophus]